MTKVLMLTGNSSLLDGINRHILNITPILNSFDDLDVRVCSIMPKGELHEKLNKKGVIAYALGFPNGHSLGIIGSFKRVLQEFHPDIIHSHVMSIMQRFYCSYSVRDIGIKYIETIHGLSDDKVHTLKDIFEKVLLTISPIKYSARCFISEGVKDSLINQYHDNVLNEVCYNPISFIAPKRTGELQRLIQKDRDTKIIGTACRISPVKNPQAFTEVMCRVLVNNPNVNAVVLGDGPEELKNECREIVRQYDVENRFHWLGYRSDASQLVSDMDCFVMTSHSEGMPTSLLECFVARTPVALFEGNGGLKDIAILNKKEQPIAVMVRAGDTICMSNKIEEIINYPEYAKRMTEKAYKVAKANFDVNNVCGKIHNIYKTLL